MYTNNIIANQHNNLTDMNGFKHVGEVAIKGCPYDFMRRGFFRNDIHDFYLNGKTSALTHVISSTLNRFKASNNNITYVHMELIFYRDEEGKNQNGKASVSIDLIRKDLNIISARDVDNNQIPTLIEHVSGNDFAFTSESNKNKFETYVHYMFGVNQGQRCKAVECSQAEEGNIYTYQLLTE